MLSNRSFTFLCFIFFVYSFQAAAITIVTGPIIGKVTNTTARILLEFDTEALITVILTDSEGNQVTSQRTTKAFIPVPFSFAELQPETTYTVSLNDSSNSSIDIIESYFTTLGNGSGNLKFAVVSCNDRIIQAAKATRPEEDLWADMLDKIQNNEIQYLFQIGDNIYMDGATGFPSPYDYCMSIINNTPQDQWESKAQEILEIIRNEYRLTWNIPTVKETLAKIPSLTIFDDHEIRDNWGYLPQDADRNSPSYFYGMLARQVDYEYQRQLREDIAFEDLSIYTEDYYYEILNGVAFFFLDYRGARSWNRAYSQIDDSKLGKTQTELLQNLLDPNEGEFASLTNFFLMSSLAIVEPGQEGTLGKVVTNKESWASSYSNEQAELFNILREWKIAKKGREVTIIGGDTHVGGFTDIIYNGEYAFLQFTSSSIASSPIGDSVFLSYKITAKTKPLVASWAFQHYDWTNKHNYGIVSASKQDNTSAVDCYLVEANYVAPITKEYQPPRGISFYSGGSEIYCKDCRNMLLGIIFMTIIIELF